MTLADEISHVTDENQVTLLMKIKSVKKMFMSILFLIPVEKK